MGPPYNESDDSNHYYSRYAYHRRTSPSAGPAPPPPYYGHRRSVSPTSSLTPLEPPFRPTGTFKPLRNDPAPVPSPAPPYSPPTPSYLFRHSDGMTELSFSTTYASSLQPHSRRRTRAQGQSATDWHIGTGPKERADRYEHWEQQLIKTQKPEDKGVKVENEIVDAALRLALERRKQEDILNELQKERLEKERKRERLLRAFKSKVLEAEVKRRKDESEAKKRVELEKRMREEVEKRRRGELEKKIKELERMREREMQEKKMKKEAERRMREEVRKKAEREKIWRARFNIDLLEEREIRTPKEKKRYARYFYSGSDGELIEWVWGERR